MKSAGKSMNVFLNKTEKISQIAVWISGSLLFLASIMIAVEVVLRKAFAISIGGADELSSYALAISCTWGFSFALFRKSHIRIDVLYCHLPLFGRFCLDIISHVLLLFYVSILSYFAFIVVKTSVVKFSTANTPLATPMWIPQSLWLTGLLWFGLSIFLILAGTIYNLLRGDQVTAAKISGISTLDEEIQESAELTTTSDSNNVDQKVVS
jgi:TRAP-type C4-dicarboxylate transport system permease small subunit